METGDVAGAALSAARNARIIPALAAAQSAAHHAQAIRPAFSSRMKLARGIRIGRPGFVQESAWTLDTALGCVRALLPHCQFRSCAIRDRAGPSGLRQPDPVAARR